MKFIIILVICGVASSDLAEKNSPGSRASGSSKGPSVKDSRDLFWNHERFFYWRYDHSWNAASTNCAVSQFGGPGPGAILMSLSSQFQYNEFVRLWNNPGGWEFTQEEIRDGLMYVGLYHDGDVWRWVDGNILDTSIIDWEPGYPSSVAGANCGRVLWPQMTLANTICDGREGGANPHYLCDRACRVSVNCNTYTCTYENDNVGSHCTQCAAGHTYVDVFEDRCLDCNFDIYHGQVLCAPVNTDTDSCLKNHLCCPETWAANTQLCFSPN